MTYTKQDISNLSYFFYSGVPWEKLTKEEQEKFLQYRRDRKL